MRTQQKAHQLQPGEALNLLNEHHGREITIPEVPRRCEVSGRFVDANIKPNIRLLARAANR
jgi:hypothetical protein